MTQKITPMYRYIRRNVKGINLTVSQAAAECGKSADTLRRWRRTGFFVPSLSHMMGEVEIFLYTEDDMRRLGDIVGKTERGRRLTSIEV